MQRSFRKPLGADHQIPRAEGMMTAREEGLAPKFSGSSLSGHKWEREKRSGDKWAWASAAYLRRHESVFRLPIIEKKSRGASN